MPEISDEELKQLKARAGVADKAERERDAFRAQLDTAKAELAKATEGHAAEIARVRGEAERGAVLDKAGITDPRVRGWFEGEYREATAAAGDKPPSFGDWLSSLTPKTAPHLAPWLQPPAASAATGTTSAAPGGAAPPPRVPGPVAGTPPGATPPFTAESVAAMTIEEFRTALPALSAAGLVPSDIAQAFAPKS